MLKLIKNQRVLYRPNYGQDPPVPGRIVGKTIKDGIPVYDIELDGRRCMGAPLIRWGYADQITPIENPKPVDIIGQDALCALKKVGYVVVRKKD
jgi:hypothetical protein